MDASGHVYVSGFTYGSLDAKNLGDADGFVRKYSPAGEVLWAYQGGGLGFDNAFRLLLDPFGLLNVLVGHEDETTLWLFDADGTLFLEQAQQSGGVDLAVDTDSTRFLTRFVTLPDRTYDIELSELDYYGSPLWTNTLSAGDLDVPAALSVLASGDLILAGTTNGALFRPNPAGALEGFLARFSSDGDQLWGLQFTALPRTYLFSLAVDSQERLYVVGSTAPDDTSVDDGFIARVSPDGVLEWVVSYGTIHDDDFRDVAIDALDQVTVVGTTWGAFGGTDQGEQDGFVARILDSGDLGQVIQFGTPSVDQADAIAAAPDGAFFVVGMTQGGLENVENAGSLDAYVGRVTPF